MHRTFRLFAALLALALCATFASSAFAADATAAKVKNKVTVKVKATDQESILGKGLKVQLKAKGKKGKKAHRRKVKVRALSKTFDAPHYATLAKTKKVKVKAGSKRTVTLKLTAAGKSEINSCDARTIRVRGKGTRTQVDLTRNTADCKPAADRSQQGRPVRLHRRPEQLALPAAVPRQLLHGSGQELRHWPADRHEDGRHPRKQHRRAHRGLRIRGNDGFSPGQMMVVRVPGSTRHRRSSRPAPCRSPTSAST